MTAKPHPWDTRHTNWRKILQRYQNQTWANPANNLNLKEPLRRVQVKVLRAISGSTERYNVQTLRRLEGMMIRAVIKQ